MSEQKQTETARQKKRKAQIQEYTARPQGRFPYRDTEYTAQDKEVPDADDDQSGHEKFYGGKISRRFDLLHFVADGAIDKGQCTHKGQYGQAEQ